MQDIKPVIEVRPVDFCERCGKERYVVLVPMKNFWVWMDIFCMFRYLLAVRINRLLGRVVM